jgi:hypothetical protein
VRAGTGQPWSAPQPVGGPAEAPAIDLGLNGHAYLVWSSGGDVRAARLGPGASQFATIEAPLDVDPARTAGDGPNRRPAVAVAADGLALVAWGELLPGGVSHVMARRVLGTGLSPQPADLTVDAFDGRPGATADRPDVSMSADSSFGYVVFRQAFTDGGVTVTRALARRMRGSRFEDPVAIDGQAFPAEDVGAPRIAENVPAAGMTAVGRASGQIYGSTFHEEHFDEVLFTPTVALAGALSPYVDRLAVAFAENRTGLVSWIAADGSLRARELAGDFQGELGISRPELGGVDVAAGIAAASDRYLDAAVVAIQDTGTERRLTAAVLDRDPGSFSPESSSRWYASVPGRVSWRVPDDLWGRLTYTLIIDDKVAARTRSTSYPLAGLHLRPGQHLYRIEAVDARGQASSSPTRLLRIDDSPPRVSISFPGSKRAGRPTTVRVTAIDGASGTGAPRISFGDGATARGRQVEHRFRRGTWTVTARVTNGAGMTTVESRRITIR